ncbi:LOW QUALITY PROTEIN: leucine-rich repeat-containing protein 3-like [Lethenteron reissneri]|uniref:LOW QUALITY PROTEIN: leucine-rich repeat-containing protein 3-like n=1 Tax=Lethenteron reissneri TaxID=7753 RepID=UPI002AB7D760|nr:LOW QUALITY PROTEIN: leucine-rich repeat-containing protein 3-like [Lethenteron reissneri]
MQEKSGLRSSRNAEPLKRPDVTTATGREEMVRVGSILVQNLLVSPSLVLPNVMLLVAFCAQSGASCPHECDCGKQDDHTLVQCSNRSLKEIPMNLPNDTTILKLDSNQITVVPDGAFRSLQRLQQLDLSHNRIEALANGAFRGANQHLQLLDLSENRLQELPRDAFRGLTAKTKLHRNPLHCDCDLQELFVEIRRWLDTSADMGSQVVCESAAQDQYRGVPVLELIDTVNLCNHRTMDVAMLVTMFGWFTMVISYVVYYVRQNQEDTRRHLEYLKSLQSKQKTPDESDNISTVL